MNQIGYLNLSKSVKIESAISSYTPFDIAMGNKIKMILNHGMKTYNIGYQSEVGIPQFTSLGDHAQAAP